MNTPVNSPLTRYLTFGPFEHQFKDVDGFEHRYVDADKVWDMLFEHDQIVIQNNF